MNNEPKWRNERTWGMLLNGEPLFKNGKPQQVGEIRQASVGRFLRLLRRVVQNRQSGVFVQQRNQSTYNLGEEIRKIRGGETIVIDIAPLLDEERALVFSHVIQEVYAMYAEADADVKLPTILIFVDELNKYAPARQGESSILEYTLDIAARGRSLGVVLISAEQFMSEVHSQVVGNCATKIIGRSDSSELADPTYRFIPNDLKINLTRLEKGELILAHPTYRQPIRVVAPKPAYKLIGH